jgi:hypothetical protein
MVLQLPLKLTASGWLGLTELTPSRLRPSVGAERKRSPPECFSVIGGQEIRLPYFKIGLLPAKKN